jgi:hypothetical protein
MNDERFNAFDTPYIETPPKEKLFEPTIEDYKRLYSDKCDEVLKLVFDIRQAEQERDQYKEMFDMQTKLVVNLELEKIELEKGIKNACQYSHENLEKVVELTDKVKQLETDKEELHEIIKALTNNKLPCNPDHNGECLVCDNWLCDCPLQQNDLPTI